jgi:hypothetical protein
VRLGAGLIERLLGLGQLGLLKTVCNQDRHLDSVEHQLLLAT